MAQLNLRERVIETTIGYVSALPGGGLDSLTRVLEGTADGAGGHPKEVEERFIDGERLLSVDVRPHDGSWLRDCSLAVRLLSPSSRDPGATRKVLKDVDGLVLVLDGNPEAGPQNRAAIELVREVRAGLAMAPPVVVQINDGPSSSDDGPRPSPVDEPWPCVRTTSTSLEGARETLRQAVLAISASMQASADPRLPRDEQPEPAKDVHPLLTALRQLVLSAFQSELAAHEARLEQRLRGLEASTAQKMDELRDAIRAQAKESGQRAETVQSDISKLVREWENRKSWFE